MDMVESLEGMHHGNMTMNNSTMNPMHGQNMTGHHGGGMDHGDQASGATGGGHHGTVYFNFQLPIPVLFFGWDITDQGLLAGSCVGVLMISILYEGLKSFRQFLFRRNKCPRECKVKDQCCVDVAKKMFNGWHFLQSILQIIQTTMGMFLMLIFMTFNVWLAFSVSLGSGVGYFLFSWNKQSLDPLDEDHCG